MLLVAGLLVASLAAVPVHAAVRWPPDMLLLLCRSKVSSRCVPLQASQLIIDLRCTFSLGCIRTSVLQASNQSVRHAVACRSS